MPDLILLSGFFLKVSLFAESFNEMLMRDFGFSIYKRISAAPEKVKDKSKDEAKNADKDTAAKQVSEQ